MLAEDSKTLIEVSSSNVKESSNDKTFPADESLFLVEIPPSAPALDGANIVGVGDNAQAALVFSDRSFLMSKVESSNTFVVVPPATADDENVPENSSGGAKRVKLNASICPSYHYELTPHFLDYSRLYQILSSSTFEGYGEETKEKSAKRHTFEELCVIMQSSRLEMEAALKRVEGFAIVEDSNKLTVVSEELMADAFEEILAVISANDWDLDVVELPKLLKSVKGDISTEKTVIAHSLTVNSKDGIDSNQVCQLDVSKIASFKARKLLSKSSWKRKEFLSKWNAEMPHQCTSYTPPESLLASLCLSTFDPKVEDDILTFFPASSLPMEPSLRFKRLFTEREEWKEADIDPYLVDICKQNEQVATLLLKHAIYKTEKSVWIERPSA